MALQSNPNASLKPKLASPFQNLSLKPHVHISILANPKTSFSSLSCSSSIFSHYPRTIADAYLRISASSSSIDPIVSDGSPALDSIDVTSSRKKKKLGVVVKPLQKPRLVLKFIWMQKDIGIALNQSVPGYGTIPLSPYYFWPRKDAWEELKVLLESKPWISELQRIHLLNQATDIINLWQTSGGNLS